MITELALIVFTETYPFDAGAEAMFLAPELEALRSRFSEITVIPQYIRGKRLSVPPSVSVETSYAKQRTSLGALRKLRYAARALTFKALWLEFLSAMPNVRRVRSFESAVRRRIDAQYARDWVWRFIALRQIDVSKSVFYTYWLSPVTDGLVLSKKGNLRAPQIVVSRAHGGDLYEERATAFARLPGRRDTLAGLERLVLISEHGRDYVSRRYPSQNGYIVSRLGVPDPGDVAPASSDGVFRVVSCSFLRALKRIELLFEGLIVLASERPTVAIEWTHIGGGELWQKIQDRVSRESPRNLSCQLVGSIDNDEVIRRYTSYPVDVFINVSSTEGLPVSIMEAQSCGIPVVATDVGGTPEIVSNRVGFLLPSNPSPAIIASALIKVMEDPASSLEQRTASRDNWRQRFDAERNYHDFARTLQSLVVGNGNDVSHS